MRKKQLMAQCIDGKPRTFLTLTSRRIENLSPDQAAKALSHAWRLLRLRIFRKFKITKLPFIAVLEATKLGWPHLHILMRAPFIPHKWLSEQMQELLDSPVVGIERIDTHRKLAVYVSKYCTKAEHKFGTAKRYWQSRDYQLGSKTDKEGKKYGNGDWSVWTSSVRVLAEDWSSKSYAVNWLSKDRIVARWRPP